MTSSNRAKRDKESLAVPNKAMSSLPGLVPANANAPPKALALPDTRATSRPTSKGKRSAPLASFSGWKVWNRFNHGAVSPILCAISKGDGTVDLFSQDGGTLRRIFFDGNSWSDWITLTTQIGTYLGGISAAYVGDGRIWIYFVDGPGGRPVVQGWETFTGPTAALGPRFDLHPYVAGMPFGRPWGKPCATNRASGIDFVVTVLDGYHMYNRLEGGPSPGWTPINATVDSHADTARALASADPNGMLLICDSSYHTWQPGRGWSGPQPFEGGFDDVVVSSAPGQYDVFRSVDGHAEYGTIVNDAWSGWTSLGGISLSWLCALSVGKNKLDLYAAPNPQEIWRNSNYE